MLVRIVYTETATGEEARVEADLPGDVITLEEVIAALNQSNEEAHAVLPDEFPIIEKWQGLSLHKTTNGLTAAFVAVSPGDPYFGEYLITGHVYTQFA